MLYSHLCHEHSNLYGSSGIRLRDCGSSEHDLAFISLLALNLEITHRPKNLSLVWKAWKRTWRSNVEIESNLCFSISQSRHLHSRSRTRFGFDSVAFVCG